MPSERSAQWCRLCVSERTAWVVLITAGTKPQELKKKLWHPQGHMLPAV